MEKSTGNSEDTKKTPSDNENSTEDPSVKDGKKMMEIQEKLEDTSGEDSKQDAEKWRNEG